MFEAIKVLDTSSLVEKAERSKVIQVVGKAQAFQESLHFRPESLPDLRPVLIRSSSEKFLRGACGANRINNSKKNTLDNQLARTRGLKSCQIYRRRALWYLNVAKGIGPFHRRAEIWNPRF